MEKVSHATNGRKHDDEKKSMRDEKHRDAKMEEQIEKLLNTYGNSTTIEEKAQLLARNFITLDRDHQKLTTTVKQNEKQFDSVLREKELLQKEYNKGVLIRDKLEQVCREQQKLMKSIKSESMAKIREEEEKRKEIQARFQQSINEIFATLNKNNEENAKLKETNTEMTKKFKYLAEQYELREKQMEKIQEQINLETQLNEAKLTKVKMETTIERDILLKEKAGVLEDLLSTRKTIVDMQTREKILKDQLSLYTDKYEDFQSSLKKSNDIFTTYKSEIDKMSKRTKNLEKECYEWQVKFEKSNKAILEMAADKQIQDQYIGKASRQLAQLQKLCRTLQMERNSLIEVLKTNNIDRPAMPELPPEPVIEPPPKAADKLDIMTKNCSELKKILAQIQGQVNALAVEKEKTDDTTNTNKKSKNKKGRPKLCPTKEKVQNNASNEEKPNVKRSTADKVETNTADKNVDGKMIMKKADVNGETSDNVILTVSEACSAVELAECPNQNIEIETTANTGDTTVESAETAIVQEAVQQPDITISKENCTILCEQQMDNVIDEIVEENKNEIVQPNAAPKMETVNETAQEPNAAIDVNTNDNPLN